MTPVDQPEFALDAHLFDSHGHKFLARQFFLHAHAKRKGDAHAHADESLDSLNGREFDGNIERGAEPGKRFNNPLAVRRSDVVGDKRFLAEVARAHLAGARESMPRRHDQAEFVEADDRGFKVWVLRMVRKHAKVDLVPQQGAGDLA